jgi:hypothetical protein
VKRKCLSDELKLAAGTVLESHISHKLHLGGRVDGFIEKAITLDYAFKVSTDVPHCKRLLTR